MVPRVLPPRMTVPAKSSLRDELLGRLRAELDQLEAAHRSALEGATHEESKPENSKDTRALEQSYLARGQALRVTDAAGPIPAPTSNRGAAACDSSSGRAGQGPTARPRPSSQAVPLWTRCPGRERLQACGDAYNIARKQQMHLRHRLFASIRSRRPIIPDSGV